MRRDKRDVIPKFVITVSNDCTVSTCYYNILSTGNEKKVPEP